MLDFLLALKLIAAAWVLIGWIGCLITWNKSSEMQNDWHESTLREKLFLFVICLFFMALLGPLGFFRVKKNNTIEKFNSELMDMEL